MRTCVHTRAPVHEITLPNFWDPSLKRSEAPLALPTASPPSHRGPRLQTRRSGVHGKGVFALCDLRADERLIEYVGEIITWEEALNRHPHDPTNPNHTFYFHIDDGRVIDAKHGGNSSRWINHSCEPNCEADQTDDGRVFIKALRDIAPGEELFYDYGLIIDEPYTKKLKAEYACWCGAPSCRGTMLSPKDEPKKKKAKAKKSKKSKMAEQDQKADKKKAKRKD
jgi:hypothetical protein